MKESLEASKSSDLYFTGREMETREREWLAQCLLTKREMSIQWQKLIKCKGQSASSKDTWTPIPILPLMQTGFLSGAQAHL